MAKAFANISFTPKVKEFQTKMSSRDNYQNFELGENEVVALSEFEKQFIGERDSFYQATIAENGWPYVQHRGGPAGFIKILDDHTIGYADFTGNRQYLSVGNLLGDDRISLILMDYPRRQRLKIWGRARLIDELTDSNLLAQLEPEDSRAPIERGVVITVEAFDWNCPKYITPRYTQSDVNKLLAEAKSSSDKKAIYGYKYAGNAAIPLTITDIRQVAKNIRAYELTHSHGLDLPGYEAGSHITVPVMLPDGSETSRSYSLISPHKNTGPYIIAVKNEGHDQGASKVIHQHWQVGMEITTDQPKNYFSLHKDNRPAVLIAGGIGITPIKAMVEELLSRNSSFELHYTAKLSSEMAFYRELLESGSEYCHFYFSQQTNSQRLDLKKVLSKAPEQAVFYFCGPKNLLDASIRMANELGIERERIHFESFQ